MPDDMCGGLAACYTPPLATQHAQNSYYMYPNWKCQGEKNGVKGRLGGKEFHPYSRIDL
jgi:hypothetical protein